MLAYAAPAGLAAVCNTVNAQVDKYVVGYLLGPAAAGNYGVATYELPLVTLVPYAAAAVLQPLYVTLFADGQRQELHELWRAMVRKVSLAVLPLAVLCIALADQLLPLVFSSDYAEASLPFRIYTLLLLHRVAAYGNILQALDKPRVVLASSGMLVLTNLALTVPLTMWLGFPGAALATVIATAPSWWFVLGEIGRGMGVRLRHVMPWGHYLGVLGVSSLAGGAIFLLLRVLQLTAGQETAIGATLYTAVVFLGLRLTGLMGPADSAYLRDWLTFRLLRRARKADEA
jgi:O-antigen/teichoic acid export membrane protein